MSSARTAVRRFLSLAKAMWMKSLRHTIWMYWPSCRLTRLWLLPAMQVHWKMLPCRICPRHVTSSQHCNPPKRHSGNGVSFCVRRPPLHSRLSLIPKICSSAPCSSAIRLLTKQSIEDTMEKVRIVPEKLKEDTDNGTEPCNRHHFLCRCK